MRRDILSLELQTPSSIRYHPSVANERDAAVQDLLHASHFQLSTGLPTPYFVELAVQENRLVFTVTSQETNGQEIVRVPIVGMRSVVRDYFLICSSYYEAMTATHPSRLEAIDMGRRGTHNAGAEQLTEILRGNVEVDMDTARRLFTLVSVLHIRTPEKVLV
jgi:uncharacterized protein (UPF0262 family)